MCITLITPFSCRQSFNASPLPASKSPDILALSQRCSRFLAVPVHSPCSFVLGMALPPRHPDTSAVRTRLSCPLPSVAFGSVSVRIRDSPS